MGDSVEIKSEYAVHFRQWVRHNQKSGVDGRNQECPYVPPSLLAKYWDIEKVRKVLQDCDLWEDPAKVTTRFLRIFSTLVHLDQAWKITLFTHKNQDDVNLPILELPLEFKTTLQEFWGEQWMFCPLEFSTQLIFKRKLHIRQILPVTYGEPLKAYAWVSRGPSIKKVQIHHECIEIAEMDTPVVFKIFEGPDMERLYKAEADVYATLSSQPKVQKYITQHYGSFSFEETETRVIIIEYASMGSLLDFFQTVSPPNSPSEYEMLWCELLKLIGALRVFQDMDRPAIEGEPMYEFTTSVHQDIQPANILVFPHPPKLPAREKSRFNVQFKLADFGLAEVRRVLSSGERFSTENEGNAIYSAPECYANHLTQSVVRPITAAIDVWSLGAVYSDVLIWSIDGPTGREKYRTFRKDAIARLPRMQARGFEACFHDGEDVLEAVHDFHAQVLKNTSASDHISENISHLILTSMLTEKDRRCSANILIGRAKMAIEVAQLEATAGPSQPPQSQPTSKQSQVSLVEEDVKMTKLAEPRLLPRVKTSLRRTGIPDLTPLHTRRGTADQDKSKEALVTPVEPNTPDISEIPLFYPTSSDIALVDISLDLKSAKQGYFELEPFDTHKQGSTTENGLYSVPREVGATFTLFDVTGRIRWSAHQPDRLGERGLRKFSVKRLHKHTTPSQFWAQYNSLKLLKSLNHPHAVETLSVFRYEENGDHYFNFLFPLVLGNLGRLSRGGYDGDHGLQKRARDSLWGQFAGLSSAVAYLHHSIQMVPSGIRPSGILICEDAAPGEALVLKLTDSDLSTGSVARDPPSATTLLTDDIWRLGWVFIEMLAFLVYGGSKELTDFRDSIPTINGNVVSDLYHLDEKTKLQAINWLDLMARRDPRARRLQPILGQMLAKPLKRSTIKDVCEELVKIDLPNIHYDDGLQITRLTPADQVRPLSQVERFQLGTERWVGLGVDWSPFPRPRPRLGPDEYLMTWEWQGIELHIALSQSQVDSYKPLCLPRTTRNIPLLPVAQQPVNSGQQTTANIPPSIFGQPVGSISQPPLGNAALRGATAQSSAALPPPGPTKDMFWCLERNFAGPTEHHLFTLLNSEALSDDEDLYRQVNKAISSTRGWIEDLFSWKQCTEVEFIKFGLASEMDSQVCPLGTGLPPSNDARGYRHSFPTSEDDKAAHMAIARLRMKFGLMDPTRGRGENINSLLPHKLNLPPLVKKRGEFGWGLHARMELALWKCYRWIVACFAVCFIFAALWLIKIDGKDLQNAFVPAGIVTAIFALGLAALQMSHK